MTRLAWVIVALVAAHGLSAVTAQQRFRSSVGVVTMNVAVRRNNRPVADLTARDFALTDDYVERPVTVTPGASRPLDITLLIDTSDSMDGTIDEMRKHVRDVAAQLGADDRLRLLSFAGDVREVFGFRPGGGPLPLDALTAGGWTSLYDALGLALIHQPAPERSHLVVVISDADDSSSTIDVTMLKALTRRSEAVLHAFINQPRSPSASRRSALMDDPPPVPPVGAVAELTGGYSTFVGANDVRRSFREALADFRRRYVLTYAMPEPLRPGWHEVGIRIRREGEFDVRARRGYVQ